MKILITGCSKGLGWGLAHFYLNQGDTVYGLSRSTPEDLVAHDNFHFSPFDLLSLEEDTSKISSFLGHEPHLDLVILNAGILGTVGDVADQPLDEMRSIMETNVFANKLIIDWLMENIKTIDTIVAISSGASVSGSRGWRGYGVSKAALNMLMKLYAADFEHTKFYAFAPGLIDTAMQDYCCEEADADRYPTIARLRAARNTEVMPKPLEAGNIIGEAFRKLHEYETGSFIDIRKMN